MYVGRRDPDGRCSVHVCDQDSSRPLPLRLDVWNHSPTGFEWGYQGAGPAQLALALVCDAAQSATIALHVYQDFKSAVVSRLGFNDWVVTERFVHQWLLGQMESLLTPVDDYEVKREEGGRNDPFT